MRIAVAVLIAVAMMGLPVLAADPPSKRGPIVVSEKALALHRSALLVDGHNDLPWELRDRGTGKFRNLDLTRPQPSTHTDIPRLKAGGVGAQ